MALRNGLVIALAGAIWCGAAASAAAAPEHLLLRLPDLPPGYMVGDDSGCGLTIASDDAPVALERIEVEHDYEACGIELERVWRAPRVPLAPGEVESVAYEFERAEGAAATFDAARTFVAYTIGLRRTSLKPRTPAQPLGDAVAVFATDDALVRGRSGRPGLAVLWRAGRVLSLVFASGRAASEDSTFALAHTQQARIENPTPLAPGENDDRLVPLDNPDRRLPIYWLGEAFDPPGSKPAMTLTDTFGPMGRFGGPGWRFEIDYAGPARRTHTTLGLWRPAAFARFKRSRVGRPSFRRRCGRPERLDLPAGRAVIRSGFAKRPKRCSRRPDYVFGYAVLDGVVVTVNLPICVLCVESGRGRRGPYEKRAGVRAIVEALEPR